MSDGNVERAITLFLETGGAELIFHEQPSSTPTVNQQQQRSTSPPPPIPAQSGVMMDFGMDYDDLVDDDYNPEQDERSTGNNGNGFILTLYSFYSW